MDNMRKYEAFRPYLGRFPLSSASLHWVLEIVNV